MSRFAIGVDLGGTNMRIAAVEDSGRLLQTIATNTEVTRGREAVISDMCEAIRSLSAKFHGIGGRELSGIGIGVPGIIDLERGMIRNSPNLPGWQDYPVQSEIEKQLGTHVVLENDANAAAFGEKWLGAGRGSNTESLCMITLGTGVGGGFVFAGKVWHGMTGMAGEIGHITVFPDGHPCKCGNTGCLEQYASATAVKRMALEVIATGSAPDLGRAVSATSEITARHIYNQAMQGDPAARHVFLKVGEALGIALATVINALNLPMYVIGGGVAGAWEAFAPTMLREVRNRSFIYRATNPREDESGPGSTILTQAVLGGDAGILGSARLAMLHVPHPTGDRHPL
jgi:glucokinase